MNSNQNEIPTPIVDKEVSLHNCVRIDTARNLERKLNTANLCNKGHETTISFLEKENAKFEAELTELLGLADTLHNHPQSMGAHLAYQSFITRHPL